MTNRWNLGAMGARLLSALLLVSLSALAVLAVGTVGPHLLARTGMHEEIDTGWLLAATGVAVLTAISASVVVARRMVAPMEQILASARAFAGGDHAVRLHDLGRPELADLVDSLDAAADEVERSEQRRRALTADIAHELRTPLTALQAGLEELRDGLVPPDHATLDALHRQAIRLGRVVSDLSDLSEAEAAGQHANHGPVDLGAVAEAAVSERAHPMAATGLAVRCDVTPETVVTGDADRLHQVVGNLLANCTAYCRPGDSVKVRVTSSGGHGILEVADTGPGIEGFEGIERGHAFDRSWRGQNADTTAGSGLGLPIVRALVVSHGGTVHLSRGRPSGTVVRIELPLYPDTAGGREPRG